MSENKKTLEKAKLNLYYIYSKLTTKDLTISDIEIFNELSKDPYIQKIKYEGEEEI